MGRTFALSRIRYVVAFLLGSLIDYLEGDEVI